MQALAQQNQRLTAQLASASQQQEILTQRLEQANVTATAAGNNTGVSVAATAQATPALSSASESVPTPALAMAPAPATVAAAAEGNQWSGVEMDALHVTLAEKDKEVKELTKLLAKEKKRVEALQAKAAANEELLAAQADLEVSEKKLRRYKALLESAEQESLLAQERLLRLMRENATTVQQLEDANTMVRQSQAEIHSLRTHLRNLQSEHAAALAELAACKEELKQLEGLKAKAARVDELEARVKALNALIASQESQISHLSSELADVKEKLSAALTALVEPVVEVHDTGVQAEESSEDVVGWLLGDILHTACEMGCVSDFWRQAIADEVAKRKAVEAERDAIAERAKKALEEVEKMQSQLKNLMQQLSEATAKIGMLTAKVANLEKALEEVTAERDSLAEKMKEMEAQIAFLEGELETEKAKTKGLVEELNMLKIQYEALKAKHAESLAEIAMLSEALEEMRAELKRNGVVDRWKQAALASQLAKARAMIPIIPESSATGTQTDSAPPPKPVAKLLVMPEMAVHAQAGTVVETTIKLANTGDGVLQITGAMFDSGNPHEETMQPAWIDWADPDFEGVLEVAAAPAAPLAAEAAPTKGNERELWMLEKQAAEPKEFTKEVEVEVEVPGAVDEETGEPSEPTTETRIEVQWDQEAADAAYEAFAAAAVSEGVEEAEPPPMGELKIRMLSGIEGELKGRVVLRTNDPSMPVVAVPVTFHVLPQAAKRPNSRDGRSQTDTVETSDGGGQTEFVESSGGEVDTGELNRLRDELARLRAQLEALLAEMDALRAENSALKDALAAMTAERDALAAKISELEEMIKKLQDEDPDNDFYERQEWEKQIRDELAKVYKETASRGVQTDSDEHKVEALEARKEIHTTVAGRELHKPRFLAPLLDDETLAARPLKPLRWLLRMVQGIYEAKFVADAVDNRYGHPHDPLPEFIYMWTCKRFGLRDLVGATRWDLANAVDYYSDDHAEVRLFGAFMHEEYGTEQLGFYLYCRSVIHDHSANGLSAAAIQGAMPGTGDSSSSGDLLSDMSGLEGGAAQQLGSAVRVQDRRYLPLQLALELTGIVLGSRLTANKLDCLCQLVEQEAEPFPPVDPNSEQHASRGGGGEVDTSHVAAFYQQFGFRRTEGAVETLLVVEQPRFLECLLLAYSEVSGITSSRALSLPLLIVCPSV